MEDKIILKRTSGKLSNMLIFYTGPCGIKAFRNDNGMKDYFSKSTNLGTGRPVGGSREGLKQCV